MTIIYIGGKGHINADGLSKWPLDNFKCNPAYDSKLAAKMPIHFVEIDRRRNFQFSQWEPEISTPNIHLSDQEGQKLPYCE
ncbi:hypothetical protein O181_067610 [Austropuccinia psidii MF-1]|uniref:Uncharacterized protein n=1 Tax=Austropuccinia psidii MF-1 TaxID=1389203 RepID=A0A9Q3ER34_9BASI|nr:hypothetical protein [Austropuccinia psidii MF-1]